MRNSKRHTAAESARKYREARALVATGATIAQACRKLSVSEATFHRWRRKFARPPPAKDESQSPSSTRFKQLETENRRLKLLLAELTLENAFLNDRLEGTNRRER